MGIESGQPRSLTSRPGRSRFGRWVPFGLVSICAHAAALAGLIAVVGPKSPPAVPLEPTMDLLFAAVEPEPESPPPAAVEPISAPAAPEPPTVRMAEPPNPPAPIARPRPPGPIRPAATPPPRRRRSPRPCQPPRRRRRRRGSSIRPGKRRSPPGSPPAKPTPRRPAAAVRKARSGCGSPLIAPARCWRPISSPVRGRSGLITPSSHCCGAPPCPASRPPWRRAGLRSRRRCATPCDNGAALRTLRLRCSEPMHDRRLSRPAHRPDLRP